MGVIKKNKPNLGKFSTDSDESLHIVHTSEDEDVSTVSDVSSIAPEVPSGRLQRHLLPVPTFIIVKKNAGKKKFRRYENSHQLETLVEDEELQAVTIYDFIPNRCTGLSSVLENEDAKEKWENFMALNEDQQQQLVQPKDVAMRETSNNFPLTPENAFRNIKTGLRNTLKKSQIPLGMVEYLEIKLVDFFTSNPTDIFISEHLSSFERLLLHGVAQYYSLRSLSFDSEPENIRLVRISNPYKDFHQPSMPLVKFLVECRKRPNVHTLQEEGFQ